MTKFNKMGRKANYVKYEYRTSSTYRAARKQQKTANKKEWWVDELPFVDPLEYFESPVEVLAEGYTLNWSNESVKGRVRRNSPRSHFTKKGYKQTLLRSSKISKSLEDVREDEVVSDFIIEVVEEVA